MNIVQEPDLVTPKLEALRAYQHSLRAPPTLGASYDRSAARRGKVVFDANCASCHVNGNLTDNNTRVATGSVDGRDGARATMGVLHRPSETGMDSAYAARTTTKMYRTTPLRALWQHAPYFHDGSAKTLKDVVEHYSKVRNLNLTKSQKKDLVHYLMSL
jgi:cytochrome c peroxidase